MFGKKLFSTTHYCVCSIVAWSEHLLLVLNAYGEILNSFCFSVFMLFMLWYFYTFSGSDNHKLIATWRYVQNFLYFFDFIMTMLNIFIILISFYSGEKATAGAIGDAIAENRAELVHLPATMDLNVPLPSKDCDSCAGSVSK